MSESLSHKELKAEARKKLIDMGMVEIKEEYRVEIKEEHLLASDERQWELPKHFIVDVAGFNGNKSIAIECGKCSILKLNCLERMFTEVYVIPHPKKHPRKKIWFYIEYSELERVDELISKKKYESRPSLIRRAVNDFLENEDKPIRA